MTTTGSKFGSIFDCASRHKRDFEAMRTPLDEHKAKVADVRLRFTNDRGNILPCKDQTTADEERLLELAFECGREVERLDSKFEASRAEAEAQYTQAIDDIFKALCVECIEVFGIPLVKECLLGFPKAKSSSPQQQQHTPEYDIASRQTSSLDHRDETITVSFRKRKTTLEHRNPTSKRKKLAATRSQELNSKPTQPSCSTTSHADKLPRQSARHTAGRSGGGAERRQCRLKSIVPGEIYLTFFKSWCLALLLPTENLEAVGVSDTMATLGLTKEIPECYIYDSQTSVFSWRKEYEDGEELENKRFYPVMYFDGAEFPARSSVGWVLADNLEEYDVATRPRNLIEHHKQAEFYLEQMKSMSSCRTPPPSRDAEVNSVPENVRYIEATNTERQSFSGTERVQKGYGTSGRQSRSPGFEAADATTTGQPICDNHAISEPPSTSGDSISTTKNTKNTAFEAGKTLRHSSREPSSANKPSTADIEDHSSRNPTQSSRVSNDGPEVFAQLVPSWEHEPTKFRSVRPSFLLTTEQPVVASQPTTSNTSITGRTMAVHGYGASRAATSIDSQLLERLHMPPGAGIPGWDASKLCLPPIRTACDGNPMHDQPAPTPTSAATHPTHPTHPTKAPATSFRKLLPSGPGLNAIAGNLGCVTPTALQVSGWDSPLPVRIVERLRPYLRGNEPRPEMFFHNGLYHCVLCPLEKERGFARSRILENHFVQKHC